MLDEREQRVWERLAPERAADGVPRAVCAAMSPVPLWGVIAAIVIFIPAALILAFFVRRHAIIVQAGEIVILDISAFKGTEQAERGRHPVGAADAVLEGSKLTIAGERYWVDPGFGDAARRLVEIDA